MKRTTCCDNGALTPSAIIVWNTPEVIKLTPLQSVLLPTCLQSVANVMQSVINTAAQSPHHWPMMLQPHNWHARQFPLVESPVACSVQTGSSLPGCWSVQFVWYAVQTTFAVIAYRSARCPPVAVFNCWRPSICCGCCSVVEQSATWYCCMRHAVTVDGSVKNSKHFCLDGPILFCLSFSLSSLQFLLSPH